LSILTGLIIPKFKVLKDLVISIWNAMKWLVGAGSPDNDNLKKWKERKREREREKREAIQESWRKDKTDITIRVAADSGTTAIIDKMKSTGGVVPKLATVGYVVAIHY